MIQLKKWNSEKEEQMKKKEKDLNEKLQRNTESCEQNIKNMNEATAKREKGIPGYQFNNARAALSLSFRSCGQAAGWSRNLSTTTE